MSINSKDAARIGLCDDDRVSVELEAGAFEIAVSVSDKTAEGVLVVPRHKELEWRKMKDFSVSVAADKVRKIGEK